MTKLVIAVVGEIASGKSSVTKHIQEHYNASVHRFSTILRDILVRLYIDVTRDNLQDLSLSLRETFGNEILSRTIHQDLQKDESEIIVIDGMRHVHDWETLKDLPNFCMIYLDVDIQTRYKRIISRGENADDANKTFEEFEAENNYENERHIPKLKQHAEFIVSNEDGFDNLKEQINKIIDAQLLK